MIEEQTVTGTPGATILLVIIKLKDIFKNKSIKIKKYSTQEKKLVLLKIKKLYFIRSILDKNNISMIITSP